MTFQYSSLDKSTREIRLLKVLPRNPHGPNALVECALVVAPLHKAPGYTALSYVWGDESNRQPVLVNGSEMSVTANLEGALRHFQHDRESILIWADAICINQINQSDNAEKSHHIPLMRNIYETASEVLTWLGLSDVVSDEAMDFLDDVGGQASKASISSLENPDVHNILGSDMKPDLMDIKKSLEEMIQPVFAIVFAKTSVLTRSMYLQKKFGTASNMY